MGHGVHPNACPGHGAGSLQGSRAQTGWSWCVQCWHLWASMGSDSESRNETWTHIQGLFPQGPHRPCRTRREKREGDRTRSKHRRHRTAAQAGEGPGAAAFCPRPGLVSLETLQTKLHPHPAGHRGRSPVMTGPCPRAMAFLGYGDLALPGHRDMVYLRIQAKVFSQADTDSGTESTSACGGVFKRRDFDR